MTTSSLQCRLIYFVLRNRHLVKLCPRIRPALPKKRQRQASMPPSRHTFLMERGMLHGLKRRVESGDAG